MSGSVKVFTMVQVNIVRRSGSYARQTQPENGTEEFNFNQFGYLKIPLFPSIVLCLFI